MPKNKPALEPKKEPTQDRSKETVGYILEAASQVLDSEGYEAFTTQKAAERAGISIGSLYQYYPNKESLCAGVKEYQAKKELELLREIIQRNKEETLFKFIEDLVTGIRTFYLDHPTLHTAIANEVPRVGRIEQIFELEKLAMAELQSFLEPHLRNHPSKSLKLPAYFTVYIIENTILRTLMVRPEFLEKPEFKTELIRVIHSYLTAPNRNED